MNDNVILEWVIFGSIGLSNILFYFKKSDKIDDHLVENYKCTLDESLALTYMGVPKDGFVVELEMILKGEIEALITDQSRSLPAELEYKFKPRPNNMIPMPNFDYSTVLLKTIKF